MIERKWLIACIINVYFLGIFLIFGIPRYGALDDCVMAAILSGAFGTECNPHMVFINIIYGYMLLPFYKIFPTVGWHYLFEFASIFVSLTIISYIALKKIGTRFGIIIVTAMIGLVSKDLYAGVQFTWCSCLLFSAGFLALAELIFSEKDKPTKKHVKTAAIVYAILSIVFASFLRWQIFLIGIPFALLSVFFAYGIKPKNMKIFLLLAFISILASFAFHFIDAKIYTTSEYRYYSEYQEPRAAIADYNNFNKQAVYDDAEEANLTGNDMNLLRQWIFYDKESLSKQKVLQMIQAAENYTNTHYIHRLPHKVLHELPAFAKEQFWLWSILCICIFLASPKKNMYIWSSLVVVLTLMSALWFKGRFTYHIVACFWLYASFFAIPLIKDIKININIKAFVPIIAAIAIATTTYHIYYSKYYRSPEKGERISTDTNQQDSVSKFKDYIKENKGTLFLISMNGFMRFITVDQKPYMAYPVNFFNNFVCVGYWTPHFPDIDQALLKHGITNPLKEIVKSNVVAIDLPDLKKYLLDHYYDNVSIKHLYNIDKFAFFKYNVEKSQQEP